MSTVQPLNSFLIVAWIKSSVSKAGNIWLRLWRGSVATWHLIGQPAPTWLIKMSSSHATMPETFWLVKRQLVDQSNVKRSRYHARDVNRWSRPKSTAAVASSKIRILVFLSRALAKHTSCLWPTERFSPPSEIEIYVCNYQRGQISDFWAST